MTFQTWLEEETDLGALLVVGTVIGLDDQAALLKPDGVSLSGWPVQEIDRVFRVRVPVHPARLPDDDRASNRRTGGARRARHRGPVCRRRLGDRDSRPELRWREVDCLAAAVLVDGGLLGRGGPRFRETAFLLSRERLQGCRWSMCITNLPSI